MIWRHNEFQTGRQLQTRSFRIAQAKQLIAHPMRQGLGNRIFRYRWLSAARFGLLVTTGLIAFLFLAGARIYYDQVRTSL